MPELDFSLPEPNIALAYGALLLQALLPIYFGSWASLRAKTVRFSAVFSLSFASSVCCCRMGGGPERGGKKERKNMCGEENN
jgi:hypothetical protein